MRKVLVLAVAGLLYLGAMTSGSGAIARDSTNARGDSVIIRPTCDPPYNMDRYLGFMLTRRHPINSIRVNTALGGAWHVRMKHDGEAITGWHIIYAGHPAVAVNKLVSDDPGRLDHFTYRATGEFQGVVHICTAETDF